jgi:hypothetical protein
MNRRLRRQAQYLKMLIGLDKSWDFYTKDNTGIFQDKVSLFTWSGQQVFTRDQLRKRIIAVKGHIRRELDG